MQPYIVVLTGFGILVLLTAWLPMALKQAPLSLPIVCVAIGAAIFALPGIPGIAPHPNENLAMVERLTEFVVILSLMGAGLKIDRIIGWRSWSITWRLLGGAMPLAIGVLFLLGQSILGLGAAAALLLAAVLAPTDPVLASDIQTGAPGEGEEDEVRFALTSEAGFNDGLAFPFVNAAIALALINLDTDSPAAMMQAATSWFARDVLWKMGFGVLAGFVIGRTLGWLLFHLPNEARLSRTGDGFVALGITCLAYGLTEMGQGYGFLAVIVAAIAIRSAERGHDYHRKLHSFAEEIERLMMMALLVIFGGVMTSGGLFDALTWPAVAFGLLALFVVRPLTAGVSLIGAGTPPRETAVIAFFGIRGMGSIYYLSYALQKAAFEQADLLWSTLSFIIVVSIVMHGVSVAAAMRQLDRPAGP